MARTRPDNRFNDLVDAATTTFIEQGYRRAQIADVARAMGVAKGTVYLYVRSKEALFSLALSLADQPRPLATPEVLPVDAPREGSLLDALGQRVAERTPLPLILECAGRAQASDVRSELAAIVDAIYAALSDNRHFVKLIDSCARDRPGLAAAFYGEGRYRLLDGLARYLGARGRSGQLRVAGDPQICARILVETITYWAVHRHWDASPREVDPGAAHATVREFLLGAMLVS